MFSFPVRFHVVLEPRARASGTCEYHGKGFWSSLGTISTIPWSTLATGGLLTVSEALSLNRSVKANGILDALAQLVQAATSGSSPQEPTPP